MSRPDLSWPERRTERIHIRVAPELKNAIEQAASEVGVSMSEFVVDAVRERADEVLAHRTIVDATYFDELLIALEEPPRVVPELLDAIENRRTADA